MTYKQFIPTQIREGLFVFAIIAMFFIVSGAWIFGGGAVIAWVLDMPFTTAVVFPLVVWSIIICGLLVIGATGG